MRRDSTNASIGWTWGDQQHNRVCEFHITASITPGSRGSYDEPPYGPGIDDLTVSLESVTLYDSTGEEVVTRTALAEPERSVYEAAFEKMIYGDSVLLSQIEDRLCEDAEEAEEARTEARWERAQEMKADLYPGMRGG